MTKEKLYKIYTTIIEGKQITSEKLCKFGITNDEFNKLLEDKKIIKVTATEYKIIDFNSLYECGIALVNNREYLTGISYLELCLEMNKEHVDTKLKLISAYISAKKYQKVFEILGSLKDNVINEKDYNLILYLLSLITNYPEEYTEKILNMEYEDISISSNDNQYKQIESQNKMRKNILNDKLYLSQRIYSQDLIHAFPNRVVSEIIGKLTLQALEINNKRNLIIIDNLKNKNYQIIISYIQKKKIKTQLSQTDKIIYLLVKDILWIKENNKIPRPKVTTTNSLEEAIKGKNYYLALKIITEKKNEISDNYVRKEVTNLLVDINKLIKKIYEEYQQNKTNANKLVRKK